MVSPAVSGKGRIRIRIVKGGGVLIGLAHKQQVQGSGYTWPQNDQGVYVIRYDGNVYNALDPEQNKKYFSFEFSSGDVVELEYESSSGTLRVENKARSISHILRKIKEEAENPLHFCVFMNNGNQVQILERN